ncbi:hypothetical protein PHLGIDRAFT_117639 [Phlebiopsis gigantea 11061_1 CR5-6]|uniref:Uncharacterized protein n=1 Tax=Phlebiopsis gigantea (strain 11061_1 CR5-6) TaxID=745531 RepID=A0A0C3SBI2_PHLG1|nr:hypothetical protein PHLGIDRAFT_117639 [Phlebiopsis gigantea 11061_1 CR5-6]
MSSTFTPADVVDMDREKDWAAKIGMMDWDNTRIVFTKRTLIEFLRYTGTTVDTNFSNIQKLPKYATFGKVTAGEASTQPATETSAPADTVSPVPESSSGSDFRPTRRVRTAPGGETHDIFGHHVDDDALAAAPPRDVPVAAAATAEPTHARTESNTFWDENNSDTKRGFRPTRRVREMPGGRDSIGDIL